MEKAEKARDEFERYRREAVITRLLQRWSDYHEHRSVSTPGSAYTDADRVADAIYQARRPLPSINTPDPKLDLNVSTSTIERLLEKAQRGENIIY
ncbi:hypothetical protein HYS48_03865 [Candidatus Woesearchaeota archaeon]|nr:hypothetical protein [Candidatus Woesearchaeota archaeon]